MLEDSTLGGGRRLGSAASARPPRLTTSASLWPACQVCAPIFAVRSREQLDDVLGSLDFTIPQAQLAALDEVSAIDVGFPQRWGDGDTFVSRGQSVEKRAASAALPIR